MIRINRSEVSFKSVPISLVPRFSEVLTTKRIVLQPFERF